MDVKCSKLLLIGDGGAGKTTLVKRLREDRFQSERIATDGIEMSELSVLDVILKVLDFAGQKVFQRVSVCLFLHGFS